MSASTTSYSQLAMAWLGVDLPYSNSNLHGFGSIVSFIKPKVIFFYKIRLNGCIAKIFFEAIVVSALAEMIMFMKAKIGLICFVIIKLDFKKKQS